MRIGLAVAVLAVLLVAEAVRNRRADRRRLTALDGRALRLAVLAYVDAYRDGFRQMQEAFAALGRTFEEAAWAIVELTAAYGTDEQRSRGDELRELDRVIAEHRARIVAAGRRDADLR